MTYDYDLFAIGAGSGGVRAARLAASFGAKVGIAEESRVGGTCVIRGCVPKKLFVYASEFGSAIRDAAGYGWQSGSVRFDWPTLIANKDAEIDRLNGIYLNVLKTHNVELFETRAILKDAHTVHLVKENRDVTAEKILISAGGRPRRDESVPGHELGFVSDDAFHLNELPKSLIVNGGGYIALEFAFIFAGLGVDVTVVYRGERILKDFDSDVSAHLTEEMAHKNIRLITRAQFEKIEEIGPKKRVHLSDGQALDTEAVFWAIGRAPYTSGLGLEKAGVTLGASGAIETDNNFQTSVPSIFALGDVTDRVNLTPVAIREGICFVNTQFNKTPMVMDYDMIPKAVFTQPEIGTVGLAEEAARSQYDKIDIYKSSFSPMKNSLSGKKSRMLMKLIVNQENDHVLGCHIIGDAAAEMIQCLAIPIKHGITKAEFDATCALHPTAAEELVMLREPV